jgi:hypothetical protein
MPVAMLITEGKGPCGRGPTRCIRQPGSYGICERCTEPIPWQRLEVLPMSRLCTPCQYLPSPVGSTACVEATADLAAESGNGALDHDHKWHRHYRAGRLPSLPGRPPMGGGVRACHRQGFACSPCLGLADWAQPLFSQIGSPPIPAETRHRRALLAGNTSGLRRGQLPRRGRYFSSPKETSAMSWCASARTPTC